MDEEQVRTYRDRQAYVEDLERQARDGWIVVDARQEYPRMGCLGAVLAVGRWRAPAEATYVVTYRRARDGA